MHAERKILLFICGNDWFSADFDYNVVRPSASGVLVANLDQSLSDVSQKVGDNYGCKAEDTATIIFEDGLCFYVDAARSAVVLNDYRSARDIGRIDNQSYFTEKFKRIQRFNDCHDRLSERFDVVFGFDPLHNELHVTFRPRRGLSMEPSSFANGEREVKWLHQETFSFSLAAKKWVRFAGYAPEMYGRFRKSKSGNEMVCFAAGRPYFMNAPSAGSFNNFFGVPTERVLDVCVNDPQRFILQNLYTGDAVLAWMVDAIKTPERNSFSYLPLSYWKKKENGFYAEALRDMNSYLTDVDRSYRRMLFDGKRLFGEFVRLRYVADPRQTETYSELQDLRVTVAASAPPNTGK